MMARLILTVAAVCIASLAVTSPMTIASDVQVSDSHVPHLWRLHWPRYAARYVPLGDGEYGACGKYDPQFDSSRHITRRDAMDATKQVSRVRINQTRIQTRSATIPSEDAAAFARALPAVEIGEYGYIAGATVQRVLGPTQMLVEDLTLLDPQQVEQEKQQERRRLERRSTARADARAVQTQLDWQFQKRDDLLKQQSSRDFSQPVKLVGFDTRGLEEGMKWTGQTPEQRREGVQIAIVGRTTLEDDAPSRRRGSRIYRRRSRRSDEVLVAVPAKRFRFPEISEEQFEQVVESAGLDKTGFVKLVLEMSRDHPNDTELWVLRSLEQARRKIAEQKAREEAEREDD